MEHASFGTSAANIFKLLNILFWVQGPTMNVPSRKRAPNHKVDPLFYHLIQFSTDTFQLGCNLSSDKQDTSFKVHHEYKQPVTFKHAGYGFLMYALFEDGYTINFYPRNAPPPK